MFNPFHKHVYGERVGALYADSSNGPKIFHERWIECTCGHVPREQRAAKARATRIDAYLAGGGFGLRRDVGEPRKKCKWCMNDSTTPDDIVRSCIAKNEHYKHYRDAGWDRECAIFGGGDRTPQYCHCGQLAAVWITTYGALRQKIKGYCGTHKPDNVG